MTSRYWNYYDDNFDWKTESRFLNPDLDYTVGRLTENGISKEKAIDLYKSGFVCIPPFDILIDRFYGGPLSSIDMQTRFSLENAHEILSQPPSSYVTVEKVHSIEELNSLINAFGGQKKLIYRGQTQNYNTKRAITNPYLTIKDYGEVSLLPSLWRKMYNINPQSFSEFISLSLLEWSHIFYSAFDLQEIERRHKALNEAGEHIYTMSEMEDCDDELLSKFGKFRLDLSMGMNHNLHTTLTTLLQHYGLMSPVLDLTESLNVALFFATHRYEKRDNVSTYNFVGTNNRQSVLYVIGFDGNEMERHDERSDFLKYLEPQRPIQQKCVVCRTNQFSINLPALYLRKVIVLDFDIKENISELEAKDIFPDKSSDKFLKALYAKSIKREEITIFKKDDLEILS